MWLDYFRGTLCLRPKGQVRHRVSRNGGMYDPSSKDRLALQTMLLEITGERFVVQETPIALTIVSYLPILSTNKQLSMTHPWATRTPDEDNILKLVQDALDTIAYDSDRFVVIGKNVKLWCTWDTTEDGRIVYIGEGEPRLDICLSKWENDDNATYTTDTNKP